MRRTNDRKNNRWKFWTAIAIPLLAILLPLLWPDVRVLLHLSKKKVDTATSVSQSNNSNTQAIGNGGDVIVGNGNIIGNNNTTNVAPPKEKEKTEPPKRERAAKKALPPPQINAPNGIAIGGGSTVTNPTVNNITVPRARVIASAQRQREVAENWITEFMIGSTDIVPTGVIRLACDGPILGGGVRSSSAMMGIRRVGLDPSDPTTLVIDLTAPESISPSHPLVVSVSAKTPVQVISGTVGGAKIEF
jgi:hypothetical protein